MSASGPVPSQPRPFPMQAVPIGGMFNLPLPQIVFNGFEHSFSPSEFTSVLSMGPRPAVVLVMPPSVAKSFAMSLLEIVGRFEAATNTSIETIEELSSRIDAYTATSAENKS